MFYTFIVLFEKSSTLIDLMDLCKYFIRKEESVTNLALTGWGCYSNIRHPHFASEALLKDSNSLNLIPPLSFEEIMK
jgi:hypothetical protein